MPSYAHFPPVCIGTLSTVMDEKILLFKNNNLEAEIADSKMQIENAIDVPILQVNEFDKMAVDEDEESVFYEQNKNMYVKTIF